MFVFLVEMETFTQIRTFVSLAPSFHSHSHEHRISEGDEFLLATNAAESLLYLSFLLIKMDSANEYRGARGYI